MHITQNEPETETEFLKARLLASPTVPTSDYVSFPAGSTLQTEYNTCGT